MKKFLLSILGGFLAIYLSVIFVSQTAMDIAHTLLLAWALILAFASKDSIITFFQPLSKKLNWVLGFWIVLVILSYVLAAQSNSPWLYWITRILEFRWIITLYLLIWCFQQLKLSDDWLLRSAYVLVAFSLYAIVIYFLKWDPIKENTYLGGPAEQRTGGFYSNPMTFAHAYGQAFCWFFGLALSSFHYRFSDLKKGFFLAAGLSGFAVLLSFTRGVWIGLFTATILMAYFYRKQLALYVSIFLGGACSILFFLWPAFQSRVLNYFKEGSYDHERLTIWKTNWQIFLDNPWFGVGYGENGRLAKEFYALYGMPPETLASHAHNQYLHFLAGTGIFGLFAYLFVCGFFLRLAYKTYQRIPSENFLNKGLSLGLIGSQIAFHVGSLTEANFEHSKVRAVLVVSWALVGYLYLNFASSSERNFKFGSK